MAKISGSELKKIRQDGFSEGHDIKARDVAFCILRDVFSSDDIAYKMVFEVDASPSTISTYTRSNKMKYLKELVSERYLDKNPQFECHSIPTMDDITFEENKAELVKMLAEVDRRYDDGEIDYKDAAKLKVEIRTKLNDKFSVKDETSSQVVFVRPKFNHICETTGKECWVQTKEFAMEHWGLIEDKTTNEYKE